MGRREEKDEIVNGCFQISHINRSVERRRESITLNARILFYSALGKTA